MSLIKRSTIFVVAIAMALIGLGFTSSANAAEGVMYSCGGFVAPANSNEPNSAPELMDDELYIVGGGFVDFIDVLANDTDPDGDSLTIVGVECPNKGYAGANDDGTLYYGAYEGTGGFDTFKVAVSDGGFYRVETVTVTIEKVLKAKVKVVKKNKKIAVIKMSNPNAERTLRIQAGTFEKPRPDTTFNLAPGATKKFRTKLNFVDIIVDTKTGPREYAFVQYKSLRIRGKRPMYDDGMNGSMRTSASPKTFRSTSWGRM